MNDSHATSKEPRAVRHGALIAATLSAFLAPFMGSSVNVALPAMGKAFSMSAYQLGWINMAFLLTTAALSIPFGRLGDIIGRKKIFVAGTVAYTVASAVIGFAPLGIVAIAGRSLQGLGSAMIFSTSMAILISVYPASERGKVLGINAAAVYLGLSSGPFVGGIITEYLGWRALFWLNIPFGAMLVAVSAYMLRGEWAEDRDAEFDRRGAALLAVSLAATLYAFSTLPNPIGIALFSAGIAGLVGFAMVERRTRHPLIDMHLFFHNKVFAFSNLAALIHYAATFAVTFLISLYLQKVRGFSPHQAGFVLVSQPLIQAVLSPPAGRLSDKVPPRFVATMGMGLCCIGLVMLTFLSEQTSMYYLIGSLIVLGVGYAFFSSPNTKAIMSAVDRRVYGVASAVLGTMRQMGMTFSMGLVMMIIGLYLGDAEIDVANVPAFVDSMDVAFSVFAAMCFGGIFASMARGRGDG